MVKQKLEGIFSKSLKPRKDLWYLKLQVNPLAHTTSPADYIILSEYGRKYLVECKQVDLRKNPKNRYTFDRLTQEEGLYDFYRRLDTAFVCILFLEKRIKNSHFYLIPIEDYLTIKDRHSKKSLNLKDMETYFRKFKLEVLKGSLINLDSIK